MPCVIAHSNFLSFQLKVMDGEITFFSFIPYAVYYLTMTDKLNLSYFSFNVLVLKKIKFPINEGQDGDQLRKSKTVKPSQKVYIE